MGLTVYHTILVIGAFCLAFAATLSVGSLITYILFSRR